MIVYESNKSWFQDVIHFSNSWTMYRILRATFVIALLTTLICVALLEFLGTTWLKMDTSFFSLLGVVLSILLSFRTTTAYDRWWEGRKTWGALVNNCRNLAAYIHTAFPAADLASRSLLAQQISNFCLALKEHLRNGTKIEELIGLSPEERTELAQHSNVPLYFAVQILQRIQQVYQGGGISGEDHLNIKVHSQELINVLGICERIKKTPIPFSYDVYLKVFISVYAICLPFALLPTCGYYAIPMVAFVFFAFVGLELMAEEIEDPFGLDCNDLPTGSIALTIKKNVFEILEVDRSAIEVPAALYTKIF